MNGHSIVLVDAGESDWKALTTAEGFAAAGHFVRVVMTGTAGAEIDAFSRPWLLRRLRAAGVVLLENRVLVEVLDMSVVVRDAWTSECEVLGDIDAVVTWWFGVSRDGLARELEDVGLTVHLAGDALAPRRAIDAMWDGFRIGNLV